MLVIEGGRKLSGEVVISGGKNSALPIMIASLLSEKASHLSKVPRLADTEFLLSLLKSFGAQAELDSQGVALIDPNRINNTLAHYDIVRKMRASVLVLSPLLARMGHAEVSLPGGCAIGTRPVDIHLQGLEQLGAKIEVRDGYIHAKLDRGHFIGAEFRLSLPSVGATESLVMAAVLAHGCTRLTNVAREPEVVDLCEALIIAGARIQGHGSSVIEISGVSSLDGINYCIAPDRVEAGTFIALAAATKSPLTLKSVDLADLANVIERFEHAGLEFRAGDINQYGIGDLAIIPADILLATDMETAPHPGFPTDTQAQFMAAMTLAQGESTIHERIFENRMMHVPELCRMGADIVVHHGMAKVRGQKALLGAPVMATDLRASASLVIAGLAAQGKTEIRRVYHLDRGYEALDKKLESLGAAIKRCHQE